MLELCEEKSIRPCSVDLRLGEIFQLEAEDIPDKIIDIDNNQPKAIEIPLPHILEPGDYVLAKSIEKFNQRHTKYAVIIRPRSRAFRIGIGVECGVVHPQYKGEIVVGIKNHGKFKIRLTKGMSLFQACFFDIKGDCAPMKHTYQNGKVL